MTQSGGGVNGNADQKELTWMDRIVRIGIKQLRISDLKLLYPEHPVHPC
jgi:hypothetical protein